MAKKNTKKSRKKRTSRALPASARKSVGKKEGALHANSVGVFERFLADDQPVIVDFWADWCGPCKAMAPAFDKVAREFEGKVRFVKVNTEKVPQLSEAFGIRSIPTVTVLHGEDVTNSTVGLQSEAALRKMAQKALDRAEGVTIGSKLKRFFGGNQPSAGV